MQGADLRAVLRDMLDRVKLFFRVEKMGDKEHSHFVRGFIYVKPGVLPEFSSPACHNLRALRTFPLPSEHFVRSTLKSGSSFSPSGPILVLPVSPRTCPTDPSYSAASS